MASDRETFDFIIVGGGTAGLVLAARLSDDPKLGKVLVIEAGVDQTQDPRVNAPLMGSALLSTPSNWAFEFVPQVCFFFPTIICLPLRRCQLG